MKPSKPDAEEGELVTLVIMAYAQEHMVREAIEAAFAQTYQPLEILLTDDNSPDGTFGVMQEMAAAYTGPHRIKLNQNKPNLGLIGHINRVFELASGVLIVYNAGDDNSVPHRVQRLYDAFRHDRPLLVHSDVTDMNAAGEDLPKQRIRTRATKVSRFALMKVARSDMLCIGATCAWNPEIQRIFGPIRETGTYEDRTMYFRARLAGHVAYIDEKLVRYRREVGISETNKKDDKKRLSVHRASFRQHLTDFDHFADGFQNQMTKLIVKTEAEIVTLGGARSLPDRVDGPGIFLRLITPGDAEFVHSLRVDPAYNQHLSTVTGTAEDQRVWIATYRRREAAGTEGYYIICRQVDGKACGTVRLYGIETGQFTWGSWILNANKPAKAALESAVLVYRIGFGALGLQRAIFDVRNDNARTIAFHRRFGAQFLHADQIDSHFVLTADAFHQALPGFNATLEGRDLQTDKE